MALFKPRNSTNTTGEPFLDHVVSFTSDDSNISYTGISAIKNSDVFASIKIIASDIATSLIQVTKDNQVQKDNELTKLINEKPNENMTGWHFKFSLAVNMLLNGNSFAEIVTKDDEIQSLHLLPNSSVSMKQRSNGIVYYVIKKGDKQRTLDKEHVLHFKYFTDDGLTGKPPLFSLSDELKIQKSGNRTLHNFFSRGINGSGVLKVNKSDLNGDAKKAIREKFEEANGSDDGNNSLRTIILDEGMDYKTLEVNTDVLKLINSTDWTTKQIAKAFGIPIERLGVESHHSNTTQSNLMYLQNTLVHYFRCFTSEFDNKLGSYFRFNSDYLFEADPVALTENVTKQVKDGLITVNEGRAKLGYESVENGDRLLASLNNTFLDSLERYQLERKGNEQING